MPKDCANWRYHVKTGGAGNLTPASCVNPVAFLVAVLILALSPMPRTLAETVTIPNSNFINTLGKSAYGNSSDGGNTPNLSADRGHTLKIGDGGEVGWYAFGGYSHSGNATGNSVIISGGLVDQGVFGGYCGSGNATDNTVTISGGEVGESVIGGQSNSGNATGNTVTISGGEVGGDIVGGQSGQSSNVNATANCVIISGGFVGRDIYGGWSDYGNATGNTVTISGNPIFGTDTRLFGGSSNGSRDVFTGNTLNVWNYSGSSVQNVRNFQYYNFLLPTTLSGAVLTATGTVTLGNGTTGSTVIGVNTPGGTAPLQAGDKVTLIRAAGLNGSLASTQTTGQHGATLGYDWSLDTSGNELSATVQSVCALPQTKALSEGWLSGMTMTNQTGDLIAGSAMHNAQTGSAFVATSGNWSRFNTGSHVDVSGFSLAAGLARSVKLTPGHMTMGLFFEHGTGNYDTFNSFATAASIRGNGGTDHIGGGVLGRMDFGNFCCSHFYTEGSFRAGGVHTRFDSDLFDSNNTAAAFSSSSPYYGLHVGGGYLQRISCWQSLDLYGKYFWTRQEGDAVRLSTGETVEFDSVNSHRMRLGGHYVLGARNRVNPYFGAAWEHEFSGAARATTDGHAIDAPSLRGDTGVGEVGIAWKPSVRGFHVDLGVQGYTGKREGVTASLYLSRRF